MSSNDRILLLLGTRHLHSLAASCRYIISQPASISARFVTDTIKAAWPSAAAVLPDGAEADTTHINSSRVTTDLGLKYIPVADTVREMAASLLEQGIAKPAWYLAAPADGSS